ncbi:MaoC family dehydratase [Rhodococcus oxybenzonivorans]|uniref:MaoC family dehydratase n=1 Tax=Rhodococcus oxybenzonivorans TaxID=1990687 RepID=UPI002955773E|nr:MaoC family dehydratase [Rhodococcus oxybenzonivorans]MDV7356668.1 MaoC family dehydratase [Rhodococcus oxybenzonivorans]
MNSNPVRAPAPHEAVPDASSGPRTSQGARDVGEPDLDSFPLVPKGNKYEDFEVDQTMAHHWGRTLTEADNVSFSTATCAWLPLHLNVEYARSQGHPDTVLNPMLVLCTAVGLSVEDLSESGGPFLGIDDCVFARPVYPGDTIVADSRVLEMRPSASKAGVGIVTWQTTATNQHGETVVEFVRTNLVAARDRQLTT